MQAAGLAAWHEADELAVMGLAEVLAHLPRLLRLRRAFRQKVLDWQPHVFIGIDAPDFNLGVEKWLKTRGIRTVHYVSPSIWAWREGRAEKMGQSADEVLCLFPMEPPIYARHGVCAHFVGHPLADALPMTPDKTAARAQLQMAMDAPVLALLPGSRLGEIRRMLPVFLDALPLIRRYHPDLQVVIPAANKACEEAIAEILQGCDPEKSPAIVIPAPLSSGTAPRAPAVNAQTAMIASDCVLLASGTAALEAMLCKRPMVIGHRISGLTHAVVKQLGLLKSAHVSLPNVLAGRACVPELLQQACTADNLAQAVRDWLENPAKVAAILPEFERIHRQLHQNASASAAAAIARRLEPNP